VLELAEAAQLASLADETPEGRSVVALAKEKHGLGSREMAQTYATFVPFTAQTRMSGVDLFDERFVSPPGPEKSAHVQSNHAATPGVTAGVQRAGPVLMARPAATAVAPCGPPIRCIRKGAAQAVAQFVQTHGGGVERSVMEKVDEIARLIFPHWRLVIERHDQ
jgi:K+-transporting ATPase ATPase B chain